MGYSYQQEVCCVSVGERGGGGVWTRAGCANQDVISLGLSLRACCSGDNLVVAGVHNCWLTDAHAHVSRVQCSCIPQLCLVLSHSVLTPPCHVWYACGCVQGTGFFALQSTINHSCAPNAAADCLPSGQTVITALSDIPAGSEVLLSYIEEEGAGLRERRRMLRDYGFTCACQRCEAEQLADSLEKQQL